MGTNVALPRGVRLNNPGNVRHSSPWQGLSADQPDTEFCSFQSPAWGFRAMATILQAYKDKYALTTVAAIIMRWAPPSENDTQSYINSVCTITGFTQDEPTNVHTYEDAYKLVRAMTIHEQGGFESFFTKAQLDQGLLMAGCEGAPISTVKKLGVGMTTVAAAATANAPIIVDAINTNVTPIVAQHHMPLLAQICGVVAGIFAVIAFVNHLRTKKA